MDQNNTLKDIHVAILLTDGFEEVEMTQPRQALKDQGADTSLVSPNDRRVRGWNHDTPGDTFEVDVPLAEAYEHDFDALLLPGGVQNPDRLRLNDQAIAFVRSFVEAGKPIAAICHGPWTLINADGVRGKRMTSWPSLEVDLCNAGARWEDSVVVVDGNLVTSRKPDDIPTFNDAMIDLFARATTAAHSTT